MHRLLMSAAATALVAFAAQAQARDQIRALYDLGIEDWIFWHPGSNYAQIAGAFARETAPEARAASLPAALTATVDRLDREGAAAEREKLSAQK